MLVSTDRTLEAQLAAEGLRWAGLFIISGHRSQTLQDVLNPDAPDSLHTRCPALAVDLRIGNRPASLTDPSEWGLVGTVWKQLGGRWGGDFRIPDWNHFDLPRPF